MAYYLVRNPKRGIFVCENWEDVRYHTSGFVDGTYQKCESLAEVKRCLGVYPHQNIDNRGQVVSEEVCSEAPCFFKPIFVTA